MDRPKILKPAVLSLSLLTIVSTGAVAPALGEIGEFFASSDRTLVQLVAVMHAVALVPSLLLAGRAAERFSAKKAILGGSRFFLSAVSPAALWTTSGFFCSPGS